MYHIFIEKKVLKFLEKHKGEKIITLFDNALKILQKNPHNNILDIKILIGTKNKCRLRIGKYRFLYEIVEDRLIIRFTDSNSRGSIYK